MNTPKVVITHHAVSLTSHTVKDVDNWHRVRWPGFVSKAGYHVGYHYVIEWDGKVTQTREHHEDGAHCIGMNSSSIGVCFMGNFDLHMPSDAQMASWRALYGNLRKTYPNIPTYPHRRYANKSCHGKLLSDDFFTVEAQIASLKENLARLKSLLASLIKK